MSYFKKINNPPWLTFILIFPLTTHVLLLAGLFLVGCSATPKYNDPLAYNHRIKQKEKQLDQQAIRYQQLNRQIALNQQAIHQQKYDYNQAKRRLNHQHNQQPYLQQPTIQQLTQERDQLKKQLLTLINQPL